LRPGDAERRLSGLALPWWIAGGWALDLFAGGVSRAHQDLDIGILRRDATAVIASLPEWEFFEAKDGKLTHFGAATAPRADVNSLWCRRAGTAEWLMELMLEASDGDAWIFRRLPAIRRPLATAIRRTSQGIPYLAPEIQLLYKAKHVRARDQRDFEHFAPRLDPDAHTWLRDALARFDPGHPWLPALGVLQPR
jgi:hypothetical protein